MGSLVSRVSLQSSNAYIAKYFTTDTMPRKTMSIFVFTVAVTVLFTSVNSALIHKSKIHGNGLDAAESKDTCKNSEPCGWALYTPGSSPRKIYKYTRNIFCSCSGADVCSLTRDALQQNSFVFYCRSKETSRYRFPDGRKN